MDKITDTISYINSTNPSFDGRCFDFHLELKQHYPEAIPMYDGNHVTTLIYGRTWDTNGLRTYPLKSEPQKYVQAHDWSQDND